MRQAARTDDNHAEIREALRKVGCSVLDLSRVGGGCPDLLVWRWGTFYLMEVKDGTKPPSARKLTPAQVRFRERFPVIVVCSVADALRAVGVG